MSATDPHFKIRIPAEMREEVARAANASNRSMTAEILLRIQRGERPAENGEIRPSALRWHQFKLRLPADLRARIEDAAGDTGQSLNACIVHILRQHFDGEDAGAVADRLAEIERRLEALENMNG